MNEEIIKDWEVEFNKRCVEYNITFGDRAWLKSFISKQIQKAHEEGKFEGMRLHDNYCEGNEQKARQKAIEECLEIINHSINFDDAYAEIHQLLKSLKRGK